MAQTKHDLQIIELKDTISQLNDTIVSLRKVIEDGQKREAKLQEQVDYLTKKLFGKSSEKHMTQIEGQMSLFNEAEAEYDENAPEPEILTEVKAHSRKKKATNDEKYGSLPVKEVILELPDEDLICEQCGEKLEKVGKEFVREEIQIIPEQIQRIKYYTVTYRCVPCCEGRTDFDRGYIVKSNAPQALLKGAAASPSTIAWIAYQKYAKALPLYRQEKNWKTLHDITLTRATMGKWLIRCAEHYLKPLYEHLHKELLKREFLMADETRVQVLKEPDRKPESNSFMWLFRSGEYDKKPIILYKYTETRAKHNAENFLNGFSGYLETDGYQGYNNLPGIKRCCCWSHIRRGFIDAIPKGKNDDISEPAVQAVSYCDKLFDYERISKAKKHDALQRKSFRIAKEKPVIDAFWKWLDEQKPDKGSRFDKAITYTKNIQPYLETYLEDGNCSLSNNSSEASIRPFTLGRKNWIFSDTPRGAESSAIYYSMIETAKANNISPYAYLNYIFTNRDLLEGEEREIQMLFPWSRSAKESCSIK